MSPNRKVERLGSNRKKVVFAFDAIAHYRETFFATLKERLSRESIDLDLVIGSSFEGHNIGGNIPWATKVPLYRFGPFSWLCASKQTKDAELLVVAQVVKQAFLFQAIYRHLTKTQKIALFGHGKLYSARPPSRFAATFKRFISRQCHWWFAYTEKTAQVLREEIGFPSDRVTVVNNAIDTKALESQREKFTPEYIQALRSELNITSENIGIFVGGMYHGKNHTKRLDFLIASCIEIRRIVPDFEMLFIGGGPDQSRVEQAAAAYDWMHYLGIKKGVAAVPYWSLAKVCLNPGLVGLSILDGFALGVPLVTSDVPYHSPEIAYLENGINGIMVNDGGDPENYASAAAALLMDEDRRLQYAKAGLAKAREFSNEAMVENFCRGICAALTAPLSA